MKFFFHLASPIWRKCDNDTCRWGVFFFYSSMDGLRAAYKALRWFIWEENGIKTHKFIQKIILFFSVARPMKISEPMTTCDYFWKRCSTKYGQLKILIRFGNDDEDEHVVTTYAVISFLLQSFNNICSCSHTFNSGI